MQRSWCVFVVTKTSIVEELYEGETGVCLSTFSPGIKDTPYGVMLVAPAIYVERYTGTSRPNPEEVKEAVFSYFDYGIKIGSSDEWSFPKKP